MRKNLFNIDRSEKKRIRKLHEAYTSSHGTALLTEATTEDITTFQETWNSRNPDDKITVDGKAGPETIDRVKKFQQATKIQVDGKIGPQTLQTMDSLDDSMWDKIKKQIKKWKDKVIGGDEEGEVKSSEEGEEEIDYDEEGMCPNANNDRAYRMIKKAVEGWGTDEELLWKALGSITSWDDYKNMSEVVRCEFPDKYKSVSHLIMDDLSGKDLDKFKAIRRAIKQDGSWKEGETGLSMWDALDKKQATYLGKWITKMKERKEREDRIKAAALKKAKEWGWNSDKWTSFYEMSRNAGRKPRWWEEGWKLV
jgi:hypothetical protein